MDFFQSLRKKKKKEAIQGHRINDTFFAAILVTEYSYWILHGKQRFRMTDMSSIGDNGKNRFFLNKCSVF